MPPEKIMGMSNRLLTMKGRRSHNYYFTATNGAQFMQRTAEPEPSTPEGRSNKRVRLSNGGYGSSSPATPSSEAQAIQVALAAEEQKRASVIEKQGAEIGETRWELSIRETAIPQPQFRVIHTSFAELDSTGEGHRSNSDEEAGYIASGQVAGRMVFGKRPQAAKRGREASSSESEDNESEGSGGDEDPTAALIRQSRKEAAEKARSDRKAKKQAVQAESYRLAENRRKKDVNLNRVTSISSVGGSASSKMRDVECYGCGKTGHIKSDCPMRARR